MAKHVVREGDVFSLPLQETVSALCRVVFVSHSGEWKHFELKVEPIFVESLRIATDMYHSGDRPTFGNVARRSSMIDGVNNALNAGESIDGATLSGPALIGIPAEVYEPKSKSLWQRFLRGSPQA
jgi:hypothetical protein